MLAAKATHVLTSTLIPKISCLLTLNISDQAIEVVAVAVEAARNLGLVVASFSLVMLASSLLLLLPLRAQRCAPRWGQVCNSLILTALKSPCNLLRVQYCVQETLRLVPKNPQ